MDPKLYSDSFNEFLVNCDQRKHLFNWFHQHKNLFRNVKSVLSIGCGTCVVDNEIIKYLPKLERYVGIDPNSSLLKDSKLSEIYCCKYEDFYPHNNDKFDLIIHCHSLYYMFDKTRIITENYNRLTESGFILIVNEHSVGISEIRYMFGDKSHVYPDIYVENILKLIVPFYNKYTISGHINLNNINKLLYFILLGNMDRQNEALQYISYKYNDIMPQFSSIFVVPKNIGN